jgi:hypothetical protein
LHFSRLCEKHWIDYSFFLVRASNDLRMLRTNPSNLQTPHFRTSFTSKIPLPQTSSFTIFDTRIDSHSLHIRLCTFLRRIFLFSAIAAHLLDHLTCTYRLLFLLSQSASDKPCVSIIAPLLIAMFHVAERLADVTMHRIVYVDLVGSPRLVRKGYSHVGVPSRLGTMHETCS